MASQSAGNSMMGRRLNTSETSDKNKLEKLQVWVGDLFRYSGLWRVRFLQDS